MEKEITETLVSFKVAKLAKEKGFNEKSQYYYILDFGSFQRNTTALKFNTSLENENIYQSIRLSGSQHHLALAPTQNLFQKWLREVHHIIVEPRFIGGLTKATAWYDVIVYSVLLENEDKRPLELKYKTYEEALDEGLFQALNLLPDAN